MRDLPCPAVSFPNPSHSTPLHFHQSRPVFITVPLIFPSTVPIALIHSNTPLSNTLHCISFLSIPSSHWCFTFQLQTLSGFCQASPLAPYWRPPGVLQVRSLLWLITCPEAALFHNQTHSLFFELQLQHNTTDALVDKNVFGRILKGKRM